MSFKRSQINLYGVAIALFFIGGGYLGLSASPWTKYPQQKIERKQPFKEGQQIRLNGADVLTYDTYDRPNVQRLIGNVSFSHGNATMTCDSAYLNEKEQIFEAFGNVHMVQGDTVHMYGRYLHYDGKTKLAKLRYEVKLENKTTTLFTDSLDYDRIEDMAYYFEGGTIVDAQNTLTSDYGQFYPQSNDAEFRYNVKLVNDSTEMTTEHLYYNTQTKVGRYDGTTEIQGKKGRISSTRGTYDLNKNVGILLNRSEVYSGHRQLVGDSIYYDATTDFGEAFGAMELHDTVQRASLYGDYGYFDATKDYGFTTSRAYAVDYSQKDTMYIGADTLELISFKRDVLADTSQLYPAYVLKDSISREIRAYQRVKVYRHDIQAIANSLHYTATDSALRLLGKPMLWQEDRRQVSGDTIVCYFKNQKLDYSDINGSGFAIEQMIDRKSYFNQVKGDRIRTYVEDSTVRKIDVSGTIVESVFYMKDDKKQTYSGMNRMTSTGMLVLLDSGRPQKTYWSGEVSGKVYPIAMAQAQQADLLDGFNWAIDTRPLQPNDVISQDSLQHTQTLSDLQRFSGAQAALLVYEPFARKQKEQRLLADSLRSDYAAKSKTYNYPYILRSGRNQEDAYIIKVKQLLDTTWQYNPFSAHENPEVSNINISIMTPKRKREREDTNESETNLSIMER